MLSLIDRNYCVNYLPIRIEWNLPINNTSFVMVIGVISTPHSFAFMIRDLIY